MAKNIYFKSNALECLNSKPGHFYCSGSGYCCNQELIEKNPSAKAMEKCTGTCSETTTRNYSPAS